MTKTKFQFETSKHRIIDTRNQRNEETKKHKDTEIWSDADVLPAYELNALNRFARRSMSAGPVIFSK
jgi:hypothetical protein